jgi:hypothetical protein
MAEYNNNAENKIKKSKKSYLCKMLKTLLDFNSNIDIRERSDG